MSEGAEIRYDFWVSSLSDKELAQTAAEAGISVEELKAALARRDSGEIVAKESGGSVAKAKTHGEVQARFAMQPSHALSQAHRIFNQQVDYVPSRAKDGQISYVNERLGFAYRLHSESDGTPNGALVRVDIDVSGWMRKVKRVTLPMLALMAVMAFLVGGASVSTFISFGAVMLFSLYLNKRALLKAARTTASAALDRANQGALPGR